MKKRVVLSAGNIAHYHHAALALQKAGLLHYYLCTFSGQESNTWQGSILPGGQRKRLQGKYLADLELSLLQTIPTPYIVTQAFRRTGLINKGQANAWFSTWYDMTSQRYAEQADIFHYVSSMGLKTSQKVKKRGGTIICDVRSEHIDSQEINLQTEYGYLCLPYQSQRSLMRGRLTAEYNTADFIIVPSSYVADSFVQHGIPREKLFVVPYGVDLSNFTTWQHHQQRTESKRPFRILYVGQIIPRKGIHYLIKSFINLKLPKSELLIFGHGEPAYQELLQKMIPSSGNSVSFLGHIPQNELWQYYQEADVFALPTLSEGSALVVYEAMAAGLPIITTPNAGAVVRDGEDGFIVPIRNTEAIKEKLAYFYEHPEERRRMGEAAAERAEEFTWRRYSERLLDVYREIEQQGISQ